MINWKEIWYWFKVIIALIGFGVIMLLGMKLRYQYDKQIIKDAINESR